MFLGVKMMCPYCLVQVRARRAPATCPACKTELPPFYLDRYDQHPPFFTQVFGWPRAGKTVFLQALTLMLDKMTNVWPGYMPVPATDLSQEKLREIREYLAKGFMPASTQIGNQDIYIMILNNMQRWGSRALVTRDCAGEIFETMDVAVENAPYLLNAPTTFMMIGPDDDESNTAGRTPDMLLNGYINTLLRKGVNFAKERRKLVVVLTKADRIHNLPSNLRDYLEDDPIWAAVNTRGDVRQMDDLVMQEYIETMERVSTAIRDWYQMDGSGKAFVRKAMDRNIELRFSLVSSTGDEVRDGRMAAKWSPRRVLDPYFWALELQSTP